jgi:hypothetical protein
MCAYERGLVYPQFQQIAIEVLTAPAMSAESERVFSGARRNIPWNGARLGADMIEIELVLQAGDSAVAGGQLLNFG